MKKLNMAFLIGALALMLTALADSQGSGPTHMKANIPFDFTLGDTTFTSGQYDVSVNWQGVVWFHGSGGRVKAIYSQSVHSGRDAEYSKLVFHHLGERYFLAQIWMRGDTSGREIPPRRVELEIMSRTRPETVDVMARK
jgi:hypothetical protein